MKRYYFSFFIIRFTSSLKKTCIFLFYILFFTSRLVGQETSPFNIFIDTLSSKHQASFSFNQSLVKNLEVNETNCGSLDDCLKLLEEAFWLEAVIQSNRNFLLKPIRKSIEFEIAEQDSNKPVEMIRIAISNGNESYYFPNQNTYTIKSVYLTDSIRFASRFYEEKSTSIQDLIHAGKKIALTSTKVQLDEVVIEDYLSTGIDQNLKDQTFQIRPDQLGLLAGAADRDILNMLSKIPGIRTPDGKPGNLNIRGSSLSQNLILFDNIPIYHTGHFIGAISPYNPASVNAIKVSRGMLPADRGGRVGGLIDLSTVRASPPDSSIYEIALSTLYTGAKVEIPSKDRKTNVLIAARTKTPGDWISPKLEAYQLLNFQGSKLGFYSTDDQYQLSRFDLNFYDINGRITHRIAKDHTVELSILNIRNDLDMETLEGQGRSSEGQISSLNNRGYSFQYKASINQTIKLSTSVTQSIFELDDQGISRTADDSVVNTSANHSIKDFQASTKLVIDLAENIELSTGYQLIHHKVQLDRDNGKPRKEPDESSIHSFHASLSHTLVEKLVMTTGGRLEHYSLKNATTIDPRISLSYALSPHVFLKTSYSQSHQYLRQFQQSDFNDFRIRTQIWSLTRRDEPAFFNKQGTFGFLMDKNGWQVDVEVYSKNTRGLTRRFGSQPIEYGSSKAKGMDLFIMKRWQMIETWASYSLNKLTESYDTEEHSFIDQRHIFNWTSQFSKGRWAFALSWKYLSGMPVIIPEEAPISIPYENRFPALHQLDLSATMKFWYTQNQPRAFIGFSLLNVYDRKNIINVFQSRLVGRREPLRYAIGIAPDISLQINF